MQFHNWGGVGEVSFVTFNLFKTLSYIKGIGRTHLFVTKLSITCHNLRCFLTTSSLPELISRRSDQRVQATRLKGRVNLEAEENRRKNGLEKEKQTQKLLDLSTSAFHSYLVQSLWRNAPEVCDRMVETEWNTRRSNRPRIETQHRRS